jgi:hypothetical protein
VRHEAAESDALDTKGEGCEGGLVIYISGRIYVGFLGRIVLSCAPRPRYETRVGFSRALAGPGVPVKGAYPGVIITTFSLHTSSRIGTASSRGCSRHSGTCNPPAVPKNIKLQPSGRMALLAWQRPSGENAAGAKRGRPAPREHTEEPGEARSFEYKKVGLAA